MPAAIQKAKSLLASLKSDHPLTLLVGYAYLLPLSALILLSEMNVIAHAQSSLRALLVGMLCAGSVVIFAQGRKWRHLSANDNAVLCLVALTIFCIILSVTANGFGLALLSRGLLQGAFIFTLGVVLPVLLADWPESEADKIAKIFIGVVLALIVAAVGYHVAGLSPNHRLVSPVNLQLWGILAWLLSYRRFGYKTVSFILAIALIWNGSRLSVAILGFGYLFFTALLPRALPWTAYLRTGSAIVMTLAVLHIAFPVKSPLIAYSIYLRQTLKIDITDYILPPQSRGVDTSAEKADLLSNRQEIVEAALERFKSPLRLCKGYAEEVMLSVKSEHMLKEQKVAAHNAFLRAALLYGLPYAVLCYVIWFFRFMPAISSQKDNDGTLIARFIFWIVTLQSLVFSTFWTNMTDPPVFLACLWLLNAVKEPRKVEGAATSPPLVGVGTEAT